MNRTLGSLSIAVFSIFLGSQITEGFLLLPYWKTLPAAEFFAFYADFGPVIGRFYTILTIIAALIPVFIAVYAFSQKSPALKYLLASVFLSAAFIASFYIYFKGANQQFFDATLDAVQLKAELATWGNWHWGRVVVEVLALVFLIFGVNGLTAAKRG